MEKTTACFPDKDTAELLIKRLEIILGPKPPYVSFSAIPCPGRRGMWLVAVNGVTNHTQYVSDILAVACGLTPEGAPLPGFKAKPDELVVPDSMPETLDDTQGRHELPTVVQSTPEEAADEALPKDEMQDGGSDL